MLFQLGNNLVTNDGACALGEAVLASKVNTIQQLDLEVSSSSSVFLLHSLTRSVGVHTTGEIFLCM